MSNLTNTYTETINCIPVAGSALSDSASATIISTNAQAAILPIGFFNAYGTNKAIQWTGYGLLSTAASSPGTLQFAVYADTTIGTASAFALATQTAFTPTVSLASSVWEVNGWTTVQSYSTTSAELVSFGTVTIGGVSGASGSSYTFGSATPVALTSAYSTEYAIELYAKFGTGVSGNVLTCEQWIVQGMN